MRVEATSTASNVTLKVYETSTGDLLGTPTNNGGGKYHGQFSWPTNPQSITIKSSLGGSATTMVVLK